MEDIKREIPHFPTAKVKKIIQQNQQIGKLSNLIPPLMQKSLQIFLSQLLQKTCEIAAEQECNKLTPSTLKKALQGMQKYGMMRNALDDVESLAEKKGGKRVAPSSVEVPKRGRKKKIVEQKQEGLDLSE